MSDQVTYIAIAVIGTEWVVIIGYLLARANIRIPVIGPFMDRLWGWIVRWVDRGINAVTRQS